MNEDAPTAPRVLLIDLDNCPKEIGKLPKTLTDFARIIVCYGGVEPKVPLGLVTALATAIHEGKLELVGMDKGGKNAADFGLAFWAGRLVSEMPAETEFTILSADADLDHVVNMLRGAKRKAKRLNGKQRPVKSGTVQSANGNGSASLDDAVEQYVEMRLLPGKPRPAKRNTLLNSIKSAFPARNGISPEAILQALQEQGVLKFGPKGKVIYLLDEADEDGEMLPLGDDEESIPF